MQLDLGRIYGTAHRIYNNNPSDKPIQVKQEKSTSSINADISLSKTNTQTNSLQHKISNDKDIKAIVNDEKLLSNEDALKKKLLENVLGQIQGSAVSIHPNNISLKSASFDYSQKQSIGNSYTQYGGIYSTESDKALGHIYAHYAHIEEETSFAMKMEFTVKTPNEEFNVSINISYTQSFKKELYEENLILKNQISEDKNVGFHHEKRVSNEIKNANISLDELQNALLKQETNTYYERVGAHKGDEYIDKDIYAKESNLAIGLFNKDRYKEITEEMDKPIIHFDKDIKDKSQFENINLVLDANAYDSLNLRKNDNGFLESLSSDSIKPKEKPLYLRIWEERVKKEEMEEAKKEKAEQIERSKESREEHDKLLALFQEDVGLIYLSNITLESREFSSSKEVQEVQLSKNSEDAPMAFNKTDISI